MAGTTSESWSAVQEKHISLKNDSIKENETTF